MSIFFAVSWSFGPFRLAQVVRNLTCEPQKSMDMVGYAIGSKDWLSRVAHTRLGEIRPLPLLCTPRRVCSDVFKARYQCFSIVAPAEFASRPVRWLALPNNC